MKAQLRRLIILAALTGACATKAVAHIKVGYVGDSIMSWTANGNSVDEELLSITHGEVTGGNFAISAYGLNLITGGMTDAALATAPKILIVEGGVNDVIAGGVFATFKEKYDLILSKCRAAHCQMMVEEIWPARGFVAMDATKQAALLAWNVSLAAWVAANEGVVLISIYEAMEDPLNAGYLNPDYTSDGIHPNGIANLCVEAHAAILYAALFDILDSDRDGTSNLMEYATKMNPALSDIVPQTVATNGANFEFIYARNKAAADVTFTVEWSVTLANDWSTSGVSQSLIPGSDNGVTQQWKAVMSAGTVQRFVRLKVTRP